LLVVSFHLGSPHARCVPIFTALVSALSLTSGCARVAGLDLDSYQSRAGSGGADAAGPLDSGAGHDAEGGAGHDASGGAAGMAGSAGEGQGGAGGQGGAVVEGCGGPCGGSNKAHAVCVQEDAGFRCAEALRVFTYSTFVDGNLGGQLGADQRCQQAAAALGGTFRAWVSVGNYSPATSWSHSALDYRLVDGTLIAHGWDEVTSGSLRHPIDLDHAGIQRAAAPVWTGTASNGTSMANGDAGPLDNCSGFASVSGHGMMGQTSPAKVDGGLYGETWTNHSLGTCAEAACLYCFEQ
jgi:hypothetical protein